MNPSHLVHCQQVLKALSADLRQIACRADELAEELETVESDGGEPRRELIPVAPGLLLDPKTFTVHWGSRSCVLDYGMPYRVLEYLVRHVNHYVTHEDLLEEVWGGPRSASSVRSAIRRLRVCLKAAGLGDMANAIDGRNLGHYALLLPAKGSDARCNRDTTRKQPG